VKWRNAFSIDVSLSVCGCPCVPSRMLSTKQSHLQLWLQLTANVNYDRVATNLENSGISLNMENSGNSQGILCNLGKIVTNKVFLVRRSNICVKQLLTG